MYQLLYFFIILLPLYLFSLSRAYIGPEGYYRNYHERAPIDGKSDEYGMLYGFVIGYEGCYYPLYLHVLGNLSYGRTTYDGSYYLYEEDVFEFCTSYTDNRVWDIEADIGYILAKKYQGCCITPIIGSGYHNWFREGEKDDDYDEKYAWHYFLLGAKIDGFFLTSCKAGFSIKGQYAYNGTVEITRLKIRGSSIEDFALDLDSRWQYSLDLYASYLFSKSDLKINFFYKNQDIGSSEDKQIQGFQIFIPSSKCYLFGVNFELGYRF